MLNRARPSSSAWLRGAENSRARSIEGSAFTTPNEAKLLGGIENVPDSSAMCSLRPLVEFVLGTRSVPAREIKSRTSLSSAEFGFHDRMGRDKRAPPTYWW